MLNYEKTSILYVLWYKLQQNSSMHNMDNVVIPVKRLWDFQFPIYLSSTFTISRPGLFQECLNVLVWDTSFTSVHIQPQVSNNQ